MARVGFYFSLTSYLLAHSRHSIFVGWMDEKEATHAAQSYTCSCRPSGLPLSPNPHFSSNCHENK